MLDSLSGTGLLAYLQMFHYPQRHKNEFVSGFLFLNLLRTVKGYRSKYLGWLLHYTFLLFNFFSIFPLIKYKNM